MLSEPSPPIAMSASRRSARNAATSSSERSRSSQVPSGRCRRHEGIAAVGGAEDGAAEMGDAPHLGRPEGNDFIVTQQAVEPAPDADALPPAVDRGEHGSSDDGVETRRVAAAGGDRDLHRAPEAACFMRPTTSPGSA